MGDLRSNFEADSLDYFAKLLRIGLLVTILRFETEGEWDRYDNLVGVEIRGGKFKKFVFITGY